MKTIQTIEELLELKGSQIGFFGGHFNPPHFGHLDLIKKAIIQFKINHIIICPQPRNLDNNLEELKHRLRIMDLMFETTESEQIYILSSNVFKGIENKLFFDDIFYLLKRKKKNLFVLVGCPSVESCLDHFKSASVTFVIGCAINRNEVEKKIVERKLKCEFIDNFFPCNEALLSENIDARGMYLSKEMQHYINQNELYWSNAQSTQSN